MARRPVVPDDTVGQRKRSLVVADATSSKICPVVTYNAVGQSQGAPIEDRDSGCCVGVSVPYRYTRNGDNATTGDRDHTVDCHAGVFGNWTGLTVDASMTVLEAPAPLNVKFSSIVNSELEVRV